MTELLLYSIFSFPIVLFQLYHGNGRGPADIISFGFCMPL